MHRVTQAQFVVAENFPPEGVDRDILGSRQKGQQRGEPEDRPDVLAWIEAAHEADGQQQAKLRQQHPAAPAAEAGDAEAVEQGRPEEFPGVGKLDQREEADRLQIDALAAQPGWQQVEQQVKRQAGAEAGEDADQHLPGQQRREPGGHQRGRVRR